MSRIGDDNDADGIFFTPADGRDGGYRRHRPSIIISPISFFFNLLIFYPSFITQYKMSVFNTYLLHIPFFYHVNVSES